ncbi:DUF2759 domain-containing protein [Evansella cellulosilytica]|uniref:DUF2759 domain-containing protein n=1 Tax=Evansella cellulosilytica (strain ATCC 21833 / DSM 2522 / FERM P-1141 / JCM 9156 / N-4) TaxID=649639 RepID=E6TWY1_EVAC2|nr:DUF2759 domain-containing protein [Evansella cellulosilytica]ADU29931.1 hypothetical protein Bcell_1668 [Evansella cellulosilytica DSM 2522]
MTLGIITLLIAILAAIGLFRELKRKNFFAVGFAFVAVAVFGWFSVRTIVSIILDSIQTVA